MPQGRQKSPGSFRDELGGVIERVAVHKRKGATGADKAEKPIKDSADLNDRLYEGAWRKFD